jgi:lipopolysaccharide/colanic/teichoic acid biosynthesis glycosyltransferase
MGKSNLKIDSSGERASNQTRVRRAPSERARTVTGREGFLNEEVFRAMLTLERRRAERSRKPFVMVLVDSHVVYENGRASAFLEQLTVAVSNAVRESDLIGWYEEGSALGVIFTEVNTDQMSVQLLRSKVVTALRDNLDHQQASKLTVTVHIFPESWDNEHGDQVADPTLYPDVSEAPSKKRLPRVIKRGIDIAGSGMLLLILAPVFAAIAVAIKLTSRGSIVYRQERLGQFGRRFDCLKFRTMYTNNDPKIHRDYVQRFIAGKTENRIKSETGPVIYKIRQDPRVTPVGRFLRKTSLDELPQFWNVLRGQMSLVGPRPPLPYEFEVYNLWHRRRVMEIKPGVTGLWQVSGRSRMCFDDMVRLDLRYSQRWSLWLDLKILLATPMAVFTGDGAY